MNYNETIKYIESFTVFGSKLGLERLTELLKRMGNPQQKLKFIHIAGTNGKGSTSVMSANILKKAGYKTGMYISPYVLCFRECMQIDGEFISKQELIECTSFVKKHVDKMLKSMQSPTKFEIETAIAFQWFMQSKCDIVCLEVGLGGRYDATNVITTSILQVITSISVDHSAILGDSLDKIALEKAGIIKNAPTVMYPIQEEQVQNIIKEKCMQQNSTLIVPDLNGLEVIDNSWKKSKFIYDGSMWNKSLSGLFQVYNAITAIEIAKQMNKLGFTISNTAIHQAVADTQFPARMEIISQNPLVVLDGAHNPSGATALCDTLKALSNQRIHIFMGILADKNYKQVVKKIAPFAFSFTALTPPNPRALECCNLALEAEKYCSNTAYYHSLQQAVDVVFSNMQKEDAFIICGSLYLASSIRPIIIKKINELLQGTNSK